MTYPANNAKNGRITRAELRELVLAESLIFGLVEKAKRTKLPISLTGLSYTDNDPLHNVYGIQKWILEVFKYYYEYGIYRVHNEPYKPDEELVCFYDKKFRIYLKRLKFGTEHLWRLRKRTMQYFWTKAPLVLFFAEAEVPGQSCLDFSMFEFIDKAYDIEENMRAISKYISETCGITNYYYPEKSMARLYFHDSDYEILIQTVKTEALKLKQRIYDGCYVELDAAQKSEIKEGFNYGKKTRSYYRNVACRKIKENQEPAGQSQR